MSGELDEAVLAANSGITKRAKRFISDALYRRGWGRMVRRSWRQRSAQPNRPGRFTTATSPSTSTLALALTR